MDIVNDYAAALGMAGSTYLALSALRYYLAPSAILSSTGKSIWHLATSLGSQQHTDHLAVGQQF